MNVWWILPSGYEYADYSVGFDEKWISLINASGEFRRMGIWTKQTLYTTMIDQLLTGGAVLITWDGELAATLSLCRSIGDANIAVLMYALVRKDHRGRGLGGVMVQRAIRVCQDNGIKEMRLLTDDYRLDAIKSYLQYGFLPIIENGGESRDQWRKVLEKCK